MALRLAATSVFFRIGSPIATRMIGVCMLFMALAFLWVALFGDPRHMSGASRSLLARFSGCGWAFRL